jgi:hypothetical protein
MMKKTYVILNVEYDPNTFYKAMSSRNVSFFFGGGGRVANDKINLILSNNT